MIDNFILEKSPWDEHKEDSRGAILHLLDELVMDPLDRELVRKKLTIEFQKGGLHLPYRGDLVKEYINFYKNNSRPLAIELLGLNNITLDIIGERFIEVLNPIIKCKSITDYKSDVVAPFTYLILGYSRETLSHIRDIAIFEEDYLRKLPRQGPKLFLEVVCEEKRDGNIYYLLIIYDRHHNKHGYVALKV